jgi:hypothetical protein
MASQRFTRFICTVICAIPLVTVQTFAHAGVITPEQYLDLTDRRATLDRVDAVLARAEVQQALSRHGVDPAHASARVAALNDQELVLLAENLEGLPAGGSALGVIGIVFIVLLILELVGVINIFNRV